MEYSIGFTHFHGLMLAYVVTGNAKGYHHTTTLKKGTVKKIGLVVEVFDSIMESKSTEEESSSSSSSSSEGKNISFESI